MTKEEENTIKRAAYEIGDYFSDFNVKKCCDCPSAFVPTVRMALSLRILYSKQAGCCSLCSIKNGYFNHEYYVKREIDQHRRRNTLRIIRELKLRYGFSRTFGFFDKKELRCRLPREKRSVMCLGFCCEYKADKIYDLCNEIKTIRLKYYLPI